MDKKFNSWAVSDQETVFSAMVYLLSGVTTLEAFIASRFKFKINNECNKEEEDE